LAQNFGSFGVQTFFDRGDYLDRNFNWGETIDRTSIYSYFNPVKGITASFYAINGDDNFYGFPQRSRTVGASLMTSLLKHVTLQVSSDYVRTQYANERKQLFSSLTYTLPNNNSINLWGRLIQSNRIPDETVVFLTYKIPFSLAVERKKSIGMLKGKVINLDAKSSPCANVILAAGGMTAVTDNKGEYIFPALKPDTYYLSVDKRSIGLGRVPEEKMPLSVQIVGGEDREVTIGLIASCKISGRIVRFSAPGKKQDESTGIAVPEVKEGQTPLVESGGLSGVLVEISDDKETIRQLSDMHGAFVFPDLRPGRWILKINSDDIPQYYHLEKELFEVECASGEEKEIVIKVTPVTRNIKFIDKGELKEENKKK
jgi:hypothetical protein